MTSTPHPRFHAATWTPPKAPPKSTGLRLSTLPHTGAAASVLRGAWARMTAFDNPQGVALAYDGPHHPLPPWGNALGDQPTIHDLGEDVALVVGPAGEALATVAQGDHWILVPIPLRCVAAPNMATQRWIAQAPTRVSAVGKGVFPIWGQAAPALLTPYQPTLRHVAELCAAVSIVFFQENALDLHGVRFPSVEDWTTQWPAELYWGFRPAVDPRVHAARHLVGWMCRSALRALPIHQVQGQGRVIGEVVGVPTIPTSTAHARLALVERHAAAIAAARTGWRRFFPEFDAALEPTA